MLINFERSVIGKESVTSSNNYNLCMIFIQMYLCTLYVNAYNVDFRVEGIFFLQFVFDGV